MKGEQVLTSLSAEVKGEKGHPFFGEMALLDGKPRMAAVHSRTPCTLLVLRHQFFKEFLALMPDFSQRLRAYKELRARQTELNLAIAAERSFSSGPESNDDRVGRLVRAANALGEQ